MLDKLRTLLALHEGREKYPYKDTRGILTIGIGHNLQEGLSDEAIDFIFEEDLSNKLQDAETLPWFDELDEVRKAAILDMLFNMGLPTFRRFRRTIDFMAAGMYTEASEEILRGSRPDGKSHYYAQVGKRAERISAMLRTGEWQHGMV